MTHRTPGRRSGVAKSPEGLAPVRAIFAHGSDEVSIKVSDEGGGDLENHLENLASFSSHHIKISFAEEFPEANWHKSGAIAQRRSILLRALNDLESVFHCPDFTPGVPKHGLTK